jgi:hypothetical protein
MAASRRINWLHAVSVLSLTVLVGVEVLVAGVAGGWAIAGLAGFSGIIARIIETCGGLLALYLVVQFFRTANRSEPISG